jgi:16S rRNA (cytidine1402-2'-O)-methyltransferase
MATVYLIPSILSEESTDCLPKYILPSVKECKVIYAENIRTTRRFLKLLDPTIDIDSFEWHEILKDEAILLQSFQKHLKQPINIAIISEAGCPGIADPGQLLIHEAQKSGAVVRPLVGPNSILLALMASGLNGQQFEFVGYLPIDQTEREKRVRELEKLSQQHQSTKMCIETPYRNQKLFETFLKVCHPDTLLCIARDVTGKNEYIKTMRIQDWKKQTPDLHKQPTVFLWWKKH